MPAEKLADAKARIAESPARIAGILAEISVTPPKAAIMADMDKINRLFAADIYEDILATLDADKSDWATKTRDILTAKSPQTCKVALRQLQQGAAMPDFAAQMKQEYAIGARVVQMHDFIEGVRALIIDKDNAPVWNPATPEQVTDEWIDAIFAPLPANEEWTPL
jgi:enoyl-CoA hydratase